MESNYKDAINQLDIAAEKGNAEAQYELGKILCETGAKYLSASTNQGYKDAIDYYPSIVKLFKGIEKMLNVQKAKNIPKSFGIKKCKVNKKCKVGDIVEFGSYPFDEHGNVRPIEWRVINVIDNKAHLITQYGIDCKPYNKKCTGITWECCSLRRWLNNDFYRMAFSSAERETIVEALVKAENNPKFDTYMGNDTRDKVFLLSIRETLKFLAGKDNRQCASTEYAKKNGCREYVGGLCRWWLRSPGYNTEWVACVYDDGYVDSNGFDVTRHDTAVRPALWVNLSSL